MPKAGIKAPAQCTLPARWRRGALRAAAAASAVIAAALAGCRADDALTAGSARRVTIGEFARPAEEAAVSGMEPAAGGVANGQPGHSRPGPIVQPGAAPVAAVRPTAPAVAGVPAPAGAAIAVARPGDRILVDSLVGQVSGKPIYADDFLAPIEDRLIALRRTSPTTFVGDAQELIKAALREVVYSELFLADAEADLTPEQQVGLLAFLREREREIIRQKEGYRAKAESSLREREQRSLSEQVESERQRMLIQDMLRRKVAPRAIVSWRDVQREFERRQATINPPPQMIVRRLTLDPASQAPLVDLVTSSLATGVSFDAMIATSPELGAVLTDLPPLDLDAEGMPQVANEAYRNALKGLNQGDTGAPFDSRGQLVWLHVVDVRRAPVKTIYDPDIQLTLLATLRGRRGEEERDRYLQKLLDKGIYDDLDRMFQRLYDVAMARYNR
jgi:hypothetical protein